MSFMPQRYFDGDVEIHGAEFQQRAICDTCKS
jgi:hypothetical protein